MMGRGTLLILGRGVKGQGQFWHSVYNALWAQYVQTAVYVQSLSNFKCTLWKGETLYPIDLES